MDPLKLHVYFVCCLTACVLCLARPQSGGQDQSSSTESSYTLNKHLNRVRTHSNNKHSRGLVPNSDTSNGEGITTNSNLEHSPDTLDKNSVRLLEEKLWSEIETRLRTMESNVIENVNEKIARLNNSITIDYLYNVYHYLIEEVELGKHIGEMRAGEIEKVRRMTNGQGKDIVRLEKTVSDLTSTVQNLTRTVEELQEQVRNINAQPGPPANIYHPTPPLPPNQLPNDGTTPIKTQLPMDCQEVYQLGGMTFEGDYYMQIKPHLSREPFEAHCRMFESAGWLVIQRRLDGSEDFYRNWKEYKEGFGDPKGEFWIGNEKIYEITNQGDYMLYIQMSDFDGRQHYAQYDHFRILDEDHQYQVHVHGYHGNAGDSLTPSWNNHDGQKFSTYDRDNDDRFYDNCAERFHGAWWFKSCFESHLNGYYYHRGKHDDAFKQNGIQWNTVGHHYSLRTVTMMIKPNENEQHPTSEEVEISNNV